MDMKFSGDELATCPHGLYKIKWMEGGESLAAIGSMHDGKRWIAPTNWTSATTDVAGEMEEHNIDYILLLEPDPVKKVIENKNW